MVKWVSSSISDGFGFRSFGTSLRRDDLRSGGAILPGLPGGDGGSSGIKAVVAHVPPGGVAAAVDVVWCVGPPFSAVTMVAAAVVEVVAMVVVDPGGECASPTMRRVESSGGVFAVQAATLKVIGWYSSIVARVLGSSRVDSGGIFSTGISESLRRDGRAATNKADGIYRGKRKNTKGYEGHLVVVVVVRVGGYRRSAAVLRRLSNPRQQVVSPVRDKVEVEQGRQQMQRESKEKRKNLAPCPEKESFHFVVFPNHKELYSIQSTTQLIRGFIWVMLACIRLVCIMANSSMDFLCLAGQCVTTANHLIRSRGAV